MSARRSSVSAFLLLLLAGCAADSVALNGKAPVDAAIVPVSGGVICSGHNLTVDTGFAEAGRHACVISPEGNLVLSVDHEPTLTEGINPSPWFAFRIKADDYLNITATLDYTDYNHRYTPYISVDGRAWTALSSDRISINERKTRATLKLAIPKGTLWVAAQPLSPSTENVTWTRNLLAGKGFTETRYGASLQGRPLVGFVGGDGPDVIVALTRQHPPETTGQEAYRGFLDRLMKRDDEQAAKFRASHRVVLAPMPNPDGVDGGYWRLNAGGQDLNRDWGPFKQPETKALSEWILGQVKGRRVISMMDFHSTDKTTIYAPPLNSPSPTIDFLRRLKQDFDEKLDPRPPWSYSHNASGGTSKGWALEALKAPGITVELWDQEPAADARALGAAVADALIDYFGDATPATEPKPEPVPDNN